MKKNKSKKSKITVETIQKLFCFASFIFLATCTIWYGGRFIHFYLENEKEIETINNISSNNLTKVVTDNSKLKEINNEKYFYNDATNNYIKYSNLTWRIVKVDTENTLYLITDNIITTLSNGNNDYITKWLNKEKENHTGILENNLNNTNKYLINYNVCNDQITDINNINCNTINKDNLIGLLSVIDYINTGGSDSFINNGKYTYLNNKNNNNQLWYINDEGKLGTSTIDNIYGIKPVIRLNNNVELISGTGTSTDPYIIEEEKTLFGSYVKLGNNTWRIYNVENDNIKLMLNDYLTENNTKKVYTTYSNNNYYHNDTIYNSLAYYLNKNFLNSLTYKDKINSDNWSNYYYSTDTNYNYQQILENTIDTFVSLPSIGDIILNDNNLFNFYTNTGTNNQDNMVYTINKNGTLSKKSVTNYSYVIPCITINKNILTKGNGTINSPYEME